MGCVNGIRLFFCRFYTLLDFAAKAGGISQTIHYLIFNPLSFLCPVFDFSFSQSPYWIRRSPSEFAVFGFLIIY